MTALRLVRSEERALDVPDGPVWTWGRTPDHLRPAYREACLAIRVSVRGSYDWPVVPRYVVDVPELRDPAFWRSRAPGATVRIEVMPKGSDTASGIRSAYLLGEWGPDAHLTPVVVEPAAKVVVRLPGAGAIGATLDEVPSEDGRPAYTVAEAVWHGARRRMVEKVLGVVERVAGTDVARRVRGEVVR